MGTFTSVAETFLLFCKPGWCFSFMCIKVFLYFKGDFQLAVAMCMNNCLGFHHITSSSLCQNSAVCFFMRHNFA